MATKQDEYRGPGKVGQAFATGTAWGVVGSVVGTGLGTAGVAKGISNAMGNGTAAPKLRGRYLIAAGVILGPAAWLVGTVRGWLKASGAKEQFDGLVAERNEARSRIEGLENKLEQTSAMLDETRARFSDHIRPRAEHGSHADAASFDKENAATHMAR